MSCQTRGNENKTWCCNITFHITFLPLVGWQRVIKWKSGQGCVNSPSYVMRMGNADAWEESVPLLWWCLLLGWFRRLAPRNKEWNGHQGCFRCFSFQISSTTWAGTEESSKHRLRVVPRALFNWYPRTVRGESLFHKETEKGYHLMRKKPRVAELPAQHFLHRASPLPPPPHHNVSATSFRCTDTGDRANTSAATIWHN